MRRVGGSVEEERSMAHAVADAEVRGEPSLLARAALMLAEAAGSVR
jgi:hypothetical protein